MKTMPVRHRIPLITEVIEYRQMSRDPLGYCEGIVEQYGDVCYVPIPGVKNYFIHDPEILKEVFVTQSGSFIKSRLYRAMKKFLGEGLLTSDGDFHKHQRKLAAPAFHKQRIHDYATTMVKCTLNEIDRWNNASTVNISEAMTNITMEIVTHTLFGSHLQSADLRRISALMTDLLQTSAAIFQNPLYLICLEKGIRLPIIKKLERLKVEIDSVIYGIISARRERRTDSDQDLLSMLLAARDEENGSGMTDIQIRDEVVTMFVAGHETTATALSWTWYMLGKHSDIATKFYAEIEEKIGGRKPSADDYAGLSFTKNIFKETLRLFPPSWTLAREAKEDVEIQGYHFPKGAVLSTLSFIMHRKPEFFENPSMFMPSRWDDAKMKSLPKFAYFPFGGGNRMCIGEGFAWMEAVLILATVASRFRLRLPHDFNTTIKPGFTLRPSDHIMMHIEKVRSPFASAV